VHSDRADGLAAAGPAATSAAAVAIQSPRQVPINDPALVPRAHRQATHSGEG
jgi:hypothetical protein